MKYIESNVIVLDNSKPIGNILFSYDVDTKKLLGMKYYGNNEEIKKYDVFKILELAIIQNEYLNAKENTSFDDDIYFDVQDMDTIENIEKNNYNDLFKKRK